MEAVMNAAGLRYEELEALDAPSWESFYQGMVAGVGLIGIIAVAT